MSFNPIHELEHKVEKLANKAMHKVTDVATSAEATLKRAAASGVHEVFDEASQGVLEVKHAVSEVVDSVKSGVIAELAKKGISGALDVLEVAIPTTLTVTIGPVVLMWDTAPTSIIQHLKAWEHNPPSSAKDIGKFIKQLLPDTVGLNVSAELSMLFVSSASLSVGFEAEWSMSEWERVGEKVLKQLGI